MFPATTVKVKYHLVILNTLYGSLICPNWKGGKYVFGWSQVSENGVIVIPGEAVGNTAKSVRKLYLFPAARARAACDGDKISPKTI